MSHAYATKIYGGEVHDIGIALLYFTPAFYCDTTDSLLFESKWQALWVTTAGIYIEGLPLRGATALWVASYPDALLHELAYKTMLFTGVSTVFFNINPLIKIDGYYALSSLLEMPELREESFRYLGAVVQGRVLRLPVEVPGRFAAEATNLLDLRNARARLHGGASCDSSEASSTTSTRSTSPTSRSCCCFSRCIGSFESASA